MTTLPYPLNREVSSRLLADPETSATALQMILQAAYGDDYWDYENTDPILLWALAREDFSVTIPEENENKINALRMATCSDAFYENEEAFVAVCLALVEGDMGDMVSGFMEDIDLSEALWGLFEVALNRDDIMEPSPRILRRIQAEMDDTVEDGEHPFPFYVRTLIEGKTRIIDELRALGVGEELLEQIRNFDETPIHDAEGNLLPGLTSNNPPGEYTGPGMQVAGDGNPGL